MSDEPTLGADPHKVSTGMLLSLGSVVLSVAGGVAIASLVKAEMLDLGIELPDGRASRRGVDAAPRELLQDGTAPPPASRAVDVDDG